MVLSAVLSAADYAALLNAVPSFQPEWQRWEKDQAEYVGRFPDELLTAPERTHEFLERLAHYLGTQVAAGDLTEATWLFAALEQVYLRADGELTAKLTVGFLESLIYAIEHAGGDVGHIERMQKGPASSWGWRAAYDYIHPRDEG